MFSSYCKQAVQVDAINAHANAPNPADARRRRENGLLVSFSIVIPVCNVSRYLNACLESVLAQTGAEWEAILVDDGSTDGSGQICDDYARADSRFVVLHQPNRGVASARNAAIARARGEWIIPLDSDDYWEPDFLRRLAEKLVFYPGFDIYAGRYRELLPSGELLPPKTRAGFYEGPARPGGLKERYLHYVRSSALAVWKLALRREALGQANLLFDERIRFGEDVLYTLELFRAGLRVCYVDLVFCVYRSSRPGSLTDGAPRENFPSRVAACESIAHSPFGGVNAKDDAFAFSFVAERMLGEFQNQIQRSQPGSETEKAAFALLRTNADVPRRVRFVDVPFAHWLSAKLLRLFGPERFTALVRAYARIKIFAAGRLGRT